jgi:hypothetical protein
MVLIIIGGIERFMPSIVRFNRTTNFSAPSSSIGWSNAK